MQDMPVVPGLPRGLARTSADRVVPGLTRQRARSWAPAVPSAPAPDGPGAPGALVRWPLTGKRSQRSCGDARVRLRPWRNLISPLRSSCWSLRSCPPRPPTGRSTRSPGYCSPGTVPPGRACGMLVDWHVSVQETRSTGPRSRCSMCVTSTPGSAGLAGEPGRRRSCRSPAPATGRKLPGLLMCVRPSPPSMGVCVRREPARNA
jgi:hypothetical protein